MRLNYYMMKVQNNTNFTGLYLKPKEPMAVSTKTINKLSKILKERSELINRLEKEEETDVYINERFKVSLVHRKYGNDIHRYIKPELPLSAFSNKNEEKIVKTLHKAIKEISRDWDYTDFLDQLF